MSYFNYKIIIISIVCLLGSYNMSSSAKSYPYIIEAGSPNSYPMVYSFEGNYFFDAQGKAFLNFTTPGGGSNVFWGYGTQATQLSEINPLPYGINVRWFSALEDQFWEGRYIFKQDMLQKLPDHIVDNLLFRTKVPFARFFKFKVYVVTGGLVTVWAAAEGEQYLVGQFYAKKMINKPDWDDFYKQSINPMASIAKPKQDYIDEITQRSNEFIKKLLNGKAEKFNIEQQEPYTAQPWLRTMKGYYWKLELNNSFELKDYLAWYVNGEKIFTYFGDDQLAVKRAVPYDFTMYFEDKNNNNELERADFILDPDEVMQAFQEFELIPPLDIPITLFVDIQPDYKKIFFYVVKGNKRVKLNKILKAQRHDLYNN